MFILPILSLKHVECGSQANFLFGPLINLDRPIVDFLVLSILCCIT